VIVAVVEEGLEILDVLIEDPTAVEVVEIGKLCEEHGGK
jgi:hypothetical protein